MGYQETGERVRGTLTVPGTSKYVKNVVVDEPSIMEASSFVVQTYTAPRGACIDNRPTGRAAAQPNAGVFSPAANMTPREIVWQPVERLGR